MGLLTSYTYSTRTAMIKSCILLLCLSGCTFTFSPTHVTTIPLVVFDEVPVPDSIKKAEPSAEPLQDRSLNFWYVGPEGWSSDVVTAFMMDPLVLHKKNAYFEGRFENFFMTIIGLSYEQSKLTGHWVKIKPVELSPRSGMTSIQVLNPGDTQ
ncbi:MAG: hypothetical protein HOI23_08135 [Deltaproteobacteria bacterium]|jgi:hypothetical protein|nr:hypothetical protein [Deltaproteobacteria bacterium]MBT6433973.1 hypothetical protein [Deltaproteobacteria bacterium]